MRSSTQPDRTRSRVVLSVVAGLAWLIGVVWSGTQVGVGGVAAGLLLSVLVTAPMIGVFLWLDRWKRKPRRLLLSAFVWGAAGATLLSLVSQESLQAFFDSVVGTEFTTWFRPLVITPVTEELFKGAFLVWILVYRRRQFTSLLDGIVFGGIIGAGFAFTEQILYFGRIITTFTSSDPADTSAIFLLMMALFLRIVMVPFMHSFLVSLIGLGVAAAAGCRMRGSRVAFVALGFAVPITLHGIWDWAGLAGDDPFMIYKIYGGAMVPLFIAMVVLALVLRRRDAATIALALPRLASDGVIPAQEVAPLSSLGQRRRWRREVGQRSGPVAARAVGRYQAEVSAFAVTQRRPSRSGWRAGFDRQLCAVENARAELRRLDPSSGA
jgi:RsiW-degrading membrane proteinase PrsW (M82 family)